MKKKLRFMLLLGILIFGGFIATSLISYIVAHNSLVENIEETSLPLTSDNIYSEIQRDLLNPIFISSLMAQDTFLRDWTIDGEKDKESIIRYLAEIQKRYNAVTAFYVSETTGNYYHPSGILKQVSSDDPGDQWYFRVRELNEDYEVNVDYDTADKSAINIFINYRVYDYSGRFVGVTGVGLTVKSVQDMIATYQSRYGRKVYFIDRQGNYTLQSSRDQLAGNIRDVKGLDAVATQILTSPGFKGIYDHNGQTVYLNSRIVPEFDWYLIVEQIEDPGENRIQRTLLINISLSILVSLVILFFSYLTIGGYQKRLEDMASTDSLTGTASRKMFDVMTDQSIKATRRRKEPFALILLDIDNFKEINDKYGHDGGDAVLKSFAELIRDEIRESDFLCRWGGDEFILLLSNCDGDQAGEVAEKIRRSIEKHSVPWKDEYIRMSSSLGLTQLLDEDDRESLFSRADKALYSAKEKGRNRVHSL